MLTYRESLIKVFERTDFERGPQPPYGARVYRLARVEELLAQLGDPHRSYPSVHIAGTKGKGSTTAMIESILRAAGYRTGMYTSPHLHTFRERIKLDGEPIPGADVARLVERMLPILEQRPEVTVFEIITALAMWYFCRCGVDWGVFETGLGGRLDATNVLSPRISVLTSISMDHMAVLGDTLEAIAGEKAGIIKSDTPAISAPQRPEALGVIRKTCAERKASLQIAGTDWNWRFRSADLRGQRLDVFSQGNEKAPEYADLDLPLLGAHQLENACVAIMTIETLRAQGVRIPATAVRKGLAEVKWPGRMEILSEKPLLVVDGAHNGDSIQKLLRSVKGYLNYRKLWLVFGCGRTHTPDTLIGLLQPEVDQWILTQAQHPKATPSAELADLLSRKGGHGRATATVEAALRTAKEAAAPDDLILVTGSLFVVAEARQAWAAYQGQPAYPSDPPGVY
jgi:dihydrofolate synthase/folylpolyglutamate synthase